MTRAGSLPFALDVPSNSTDVEAIFGDKEGHENNGTGPELQKAMSMPVNGALPDNRSDSLALSVRILSAADNRESVKATLKLLLDSVDVAPEAKAARLVESVEEMLGAQYIRARHLALIMEKFPSECQVEKVPMFSTYRVEIVVSLFPRVKDVHNFEFVMRVMKPHEQAYLYARLGRLMLFNPMKPVICL